MAAKTKKAPAIVSLDDFDESLNVLVYGNSGVGKTVFGASGNKTLILAAEKGTVSAKRQGSNADAWMINEWSDLGAAYVWLRDTPDHGYNWVCIDSVTDMQAKLKQSILDDAITKKPEHNPDALELQDWVPYYERYKKTIRMFCTLPVNTLFVALAAQHENEEGDTIVLPDIEGKGYQISTWTCAQTTAYGYFTVKNIKEGEDIKQVRRTYWQTRPPYQAKDRYDVLGRYTDDLTLEMVGNIMNGKMDHPVKTAEKVEA